MYRSGKANCQRYSLIKCFYLCKKNTQTLAACHVFSSTITLTLDLPTERNNMHFERESKGNVGMETRQMFYRAPFCPQLLISSLLERKCYEVVTQENVFFSHCFQLSI